MVNFKDIGWTIAYSALIALGIITFIYWLTGIRQVAEELKLGWQIPLALILAGWVVFVGLFGFKHRREKGEWPSLERIDLTDRRP